VTILFSTPIQSLRCAGNVENTKKIYPGVYFKNKPDGKKPVGVRVKTVLKIILKKQSTRAWNEDGSMGSRENSDEASDLHREEFLD
jgi:hypothetical protein